MNTVVKYGAIGLGTFVVLLVVALVIFLVTFDPNAYKDRIAAFVQKETGRTLVFDGDLKLLFFPRLGVAMGGLHLSNHAGFGSAPMLSANAARVTVRSLPLLLGRVRFGMLELDGLDLNMARNAQGVTNWEDMVGRASAEVAGPKRDEPFSLEVEGIKVTDGSLQWDDRMMDVRFALRGIALSTGKISEKSLFPVDLALSFECPKPDVRGTLSLTGRSSIDFQKREYNQMDAELSLSATGSDIPGGRADLDTVVKLLTTNFNTGHALISGLESSAYGATLHLDGTLEGLMQGLTGADIAVALDAPDLRKTLASLGETPPDTADSAAFSTAKAACTVTFTTGHLTVKDLDATVDGCRIAGSARVDGGEDGPRYFVRLDAGDIDLDRYLPGRGKGGTAMGGEGRMGVTILPAGLLRRLDLDLEAKAAALKVGGARLAKVVAVVRAAKGVITADPLSAEGYGGTLKTTATVDARGQTVQTGLNVAVDKLDVGGLAKDVTGKTEYAGIADFSSALTCRGSCPRTMLETLDGKFSFQLADGVFPGVDLIRMTRSAHTSKNKQGKVVASDADATRFGSITGTGTAKDGVLDNRDLEVKAPGLRADGKGAVSLVSRKIDYLVKAKLVPQAEGQGGKASGDLFGVMVPIHVTGTLDDPDYWVSVTEYVKALGGVVIDTVGSVLGGVKSVVKGVGSVLGGSGDGAESGKSSKKSGFLGIF